MAKFGDSDLLKCSFCGKSQKQVKKLIAGPGVYICDECIDLCNEIIEEELTAVRDQYGDDRRTEITTDYSDLADLDLGEGESVVPVQLGDSDELYLGQPVIAIGNALLLSDSVSAGIVSCTSIEQCS